MPEPAFKLCSCNGTVSLDASTLAKALQLQAPVRIQSGLCRREVGAFEAAVKSGEPVVVACTQEAALFQELSTQLGTKGEVRYVNIREAAGWSAEGKGATPKIAALLAMAALPDPEPVPRVSYRSQGRLLVIGQGAVALEWAERLVGELDVSVLVTSRSGASELPVDRRYPVFSGTVKALKGYLGAFQVSWVQDNPIDLEVCTRCNACIQACPEQAIDFSYQVDLDKCRAHRHCVAVCGAVGAIDFERQERARSDSFDLVLDLSEPPLLSLRQPPQGYFAPGRDPLDQALAVNQCLGLVGEFEKPKFFAYREELCAHARSKITGCSRCLSVCSTGAISEDGDYVKVEPHLCMGCGGCTAVCPSGALTYAYPRMADTGLRLRTLLQTYFRAGGEDACLLFHNPTDGRELIARLARRSRLPQSAGGKGLPGRVIPVEVFHVGSIGLDLLLGAVALGACQAAVLATGTEAPEYLAALKEQMGFGEEILQGLGYTGCHFTLLEAQEPVALERALWELTPAQGVKPATFHLTNEKRTTLEFIFAHLAKHAPQSREEIPLSGGAPYGTLEINKEACTLCMACVGACPEKALADGQDRPQIKFIEANCVQCGLCRATCPENAIALRPRLLLDRGAKSPRVLNEAKPFLCVRCGKPFATRQMMDAMLGRLATHSLWSEPGALERLKMCADCRVIDLMQREKGLSIFEVRP